MEKCEYCGRNNSGKEVCDGCGAPLPPEVEKAPEMPDIGVEITHSKFINSKLTTKGSGIKLDEITSVGSDFDIDTSK